MTPSHIHCTVCKEPFEVSEEDPDSTLSDALQHVGRLHPWADPAKALVEGKPVLGANP